MILDINKLPKKFNEFNYFEKNENGVGCTLYSYSIKSNMIIVCELDNFEIENSFCVDNKALEMLKVLSPIDEIVVNKNFIIKSKKGSYKAKLIENNMFRKPTMNFQYGFKADLSRLKIASKFCAKTDKKPILTGVNVNSNGDINATDSFVAYRYVNGENVGVEIVSITIPSDFIDFISKITNENTINIDFNNNICMIQIDNIKYINNLLEGNYPNLSRIFESKYSASLFEFNINELKEKVEIAKNVGANKDMPIYITIANDTFIANGNNDFSGELNVVNNDRFEYTFTISLDYLSDVLVCLKDNEKMELRYNGSVRPIFIEENGNEFLILPVRKE